MPACGTRAKYQAGCRCLHCRAANALYEAQYRQQKRDGRPLLGSLTPAARTHTLMKALRAEMSRRQLALALNWYRNYTRIQRAGTVTVRTALKVQRAYRLSRDVDSQRLPFEQHQVAMETLNELGRS